MNMFLWNSLAFNTGLDSGAYFLKIPRSQYTYRGATWAFDWLPKALIGIVLVTPKRKSYSTVPFTKPKWSQSVAVQSRNRTVNANLM